MEILIPADVNVTVEVDRELEMHAVKIMGRVHWKHPRHGSQRLTPVEELVLAAAKAALLNITMIREGGGNEQSAKHTVGSG